MDTPGANFQFGQCQLIAVTTDSKSVTRQDKSLFPPHITVHGGQRRAPVLMEEKAGTLTYPSLEMTPHFLSSRGPG